MAAERDAPGAGGQLPSSESDVAAPVAPALTRLARAQNAAGPFRHATFSVYWVGGFFSNAGTWLQSVAGSIFVYQLTGSEFQVGLLNFVSFLPILLFSVPGGIVSDRVDRRAIVVVTHVFAGISAAALAVLTLSGHPSELSLIMSAFVINTAYAFAKPALQSVIPDLVPPAELTDAVALNSLQFITGQLVGPLVAAAVIATAGAGWAFAINAVTFAGPIVAMAYLWRRGVAGRPREHAGRARAGLDDAVSYLRAEPWVLALLLGVLCTGAALEVVRTLSPALAVGVGSVESSAGLIVAAQSAGSAVGLLLFVPLRRRERSRQMAFVGLGFQALALAVVAASRDLAITCVAASFIGLGFAFCFPVLTSLLQGEVPDRMRGRVMSFHTLANLGSRPFTALAAGSLGSLAGPFGAVLAGVGLAPVGVVALKEALDRLDRSTQGEDDEPEAEIVD